MPEQTERDRPLLVLVDGHAVAYRAYFALPVDAFSTDNGEPTNATYGFTRAIMDVLNANPDYFAISFDAGLSGREEVYPEYKGTREKMPDDLSIQIERILQIVEAFNIPTLAIEGYEADDVIGTVARQAEEQGCDVLVITGDRDLLQLLTGHTAIQLPRRGADDQVWTPADFAAEYQGLAPPQLPDIKALMGDSSDNIPGVQGIGKKTAPQLIKQYDSLEALYEHIGEFSGKRREYLERDRDQAFMSKELATIRRNLPIEIDLEACRTHDYDPAQVAAVFREVQFRSLFDRLRKMHADDFGEGEPVILDESARIDVEQSIVTTEAGLQAMVKALAGADWLAFDTETTGLDQMQAKLVGISLAANGEQGYYIPLGHIDPASPEQMEGGLHEDGTLNLSGSDAPRQASLFEADLPEGTPQQLSIQTVLDALRPLLTDPDIPKMAHNAAYDLVILRRYGVDVQPIRFDTMLAEWVRDPSSRNLGLKNLVSFRLGKTMREITDLIGSGAKQTSFARVPIEDAADYAIADAVLLHPLRESLLADFQTARIRELYEEIELPLIPIIADMEMHGVLLDMPYLEALSAELDERLRAIEEEVYELSGYGEFNINSLNQLNEVLFDVLKLPTEGLRETKTGNYSLTASVLEDLRPYHPIISMILDYRHLGKLKSTYVDALPALVNPQTGRVHTSYNQTGTVTGRFSSADPNLQNIPIRSDEGRRIRKAFIAAEGHQLLAVDYSQVELRILAHYSEDEALLEAFRQGQDIHTSTAAAVYRVPMEEVTFEQRSFAKSVNFGLMYGMSAFRLANDSGLSRTEAQAFIDTYFEQFPGVKAYLDRSRAQAHEKGYVETLLGRRRHFPELQSQGKDKVSHVRRAAAEREAINMPIQGTAADILKIAMINLDQALTMGGYQAQMMLQVHDELVLEVPDDELNAVVPLVRDVMESAYELKTPLQADAKVGRNWHDMQDVS